VVAKPSAVVPEINVASANYVELGSPWPMPIEITPASAVPASSVLRLHGLPASITLSEGSRVSADTWVVPIASLPNLDLLAADGPRETSEFSLFLVEREGRWRGDARPAILTAGDPLAPPGAVGRKIARPAAAPTTVTPAPPPALDPRGSIKPAGTQDAAAE